MTTTPTIQYDSATPRRPIIDETRSLWERRALVRLLVSRDLTLRYKRSILWDPLSGQVEVSALAVDAANGVDAVHLPTTLESRYLVSPCR